MAKYQIRISRGGNTSTLALRDGISDKAARRQLAKFVPGRGSQSRSKHYRGAIVLDLVCDGEKIAQRTIPPLGG